MKIVVVGAGKLGFSLAQHLTEEGHDITVIEQDEKRRDIIQSYLDILTICGNGASPHVLHEAGVEFAQMVIAVTDSDESNLIACAVAKQAGAKLTIARVRNEDYNRKDQTVFEQLLGIDLLINPEMVTALEISRILRTPNALDVEDFANGRIQLLEVKLREDSPYINIPLKRLTLPPKVLIAGIMRSDRMIIPGGDDLLLAHDCVFFVGDLQAVKQFEDHFSNRKSKVERILIIGAGRAGRYLAVLLEKAGMNVKIMDKDPVRCQLAATLLQSSMVLQADGTDIDILAEEGANEADAVICLTDDDKLNLLLALLTKHLGAKRTLVRLERNEYAPLTEKVGVDAAISPRLLTASVILRLVRRGGIVHLSLLEGAKAEALEVLISADSPLAGLALKDANFPRHALIGAVVRGNETIIPSGATEILAGDRVIIFSLPDVANQVIDVLSGRNE